MSHPGAPVDDRLHRIRDRHFDCYVDLAAAGEEANGGERAAWSEVLDSEIANIRSALEWGLSTGRPETATFAASLGWYWQASRRFAEGRQMLDRALRLRDVAAAARMDALYAAGELARDQRDLMGARERYEASRRLAASAGEHRRQALAATGVGWVCFDVARLDEAVEAFTEALDLSDNLTVAEHAYALRGLGWVQNRKGEKDAGFKAHRDARALLEELGDPGLTTHYLVETEFLVQNGRPEEALVLADKALALARAGAGDLIFALIAREKAAAALGDAELVRRAVVEGIEFTQARGVEKWHAHFQGRLADVTMSEGDMDTARTALDRALHVLDALGDLNRDDQGVRAGLLARRARLAEDDGDLDLAEELHRQVVLARTGSSPYLQAAALSALAELLSQHGDARRARLALVEALGAVTGDRTPSTDLRIALAIHDNELEEALRILAETLNEIAAHGPNPGAHLFRASLLAELDRLDESVAVLEAAVAAGAAPQDVRSHLDRARVRIALGDSEGARSDLAQTDRVSGSGWASDQLELATTLARLALLEGRGYTAVALWSAVQDYRRANRRLTPRLSRRFEEPLRELEFTGGSATLDSRAALDALRSAVAAEFAELARDRE